MPKNYHVVNHDDKKATLKSEPLAQALAKDGQMLLPLLDLINTAQCAIDDLIDVMGRATIEAILKMSAAEVAGPKQQGKKASREVRYYGSQSGRVSLKERKIQVNKPRLRRFNADDGKSVEVEIPAYEAMNSNDSLSARMLEILMAGVSTRQYATVLPEMANTVGVSKSQISRETIEAGEKVLKELAEKRFDDKLILAVWIDGIQLGDYHVICAVGVDSSGNKHVLGLRQGATENAEVVKPLLEDLVERGLDPKQKRLFVLDGAKALRSAVRTVFGDETKVQRCRNHKTRNVVGYLPKGQQHQARITLRSAFNLGGRNGKEKLEQYASWLEREWPNAAGSLREGLDELFTIDELGLSKSLKRSLGSTNIIDNSHSAARQKIGRVKNWQSGEMALRWMAMAYDVSSKKFKRIMGYNDLWMLGRVDKI
jgi:transposase-like protein